MFFEGFLPFLYTTSYTISYTTSYVKYTISYVKNTISYIKYTISYTTSYKMCDIVCFCCWFLPFLYTTSYTISYKKVRCRIRYATSRRYITISYVHIVCLVAILRYRTSKSQKKYDMTVRCRMRFSYSVTVRCRMRFFLRTWTGVCGGSHWPCPWSAAADRSCLMILGPPRWSVLHSDSPDALSLSLACATANVSGDSLVRAKMGISS